MTKTPDLNGLPGLTEVEHGTMLTSGLRILRLEAEAGACRQERNLRRFIKKALDLATRPRYWRLQDGGCGRAKQRIRRGPSVSAAAEASARPVASAVAPTTGEVLQCAPKMMTDRSFDSLFQGPGL